MPSRFGVSPINIWLWACSTLGPCLGSQLTRACASFGLALGVPMSCLSQQPTTDWFQLHKLSKDQWFGWMQKRCKLVLYNMRGIRCLNYLHQQTRPDVFGSSIRKFNHRKATCTTINRRNPKPKIELVRLSLGDLMPCSSTLLRYVCFAPARHSVSAFRCPLDDQVFFFLRARPLTALMMQNMTQTE